ncbi:MAG TPA: CPBP family intramembrane metalloprotease [Epulopiscium sp.]|nr:CPBP family intramembrane metalloprotease [Candidatus Epulonipiscium sp.]
MGVDKSNFLAIALYISFVNSLLEEFFFRGFIFANLNRISGRGFAYIMSAFIFSIYHLAIMGRWFSPLIFIIAMAGLFVGALIFNYLNEKGGNIYHSWLVHLMANLEINTVGFIMFGMI